MLLVVDQVQFCHSLHRWGSVICRLEREVLVHLLEADRGVIHALRELREDGLIVDANTHDVIHPALCAEQLHVVAPSHRVHRQPGLLLRHELPRKHLTKPLLGKLLEVVPRDTAGRRPHARHVQPIAPIVGADRRVPGQHPPPEGGEAEEQGGEAHDRVEAALVPDAVGGDEDVVPEGGGDGDDDGAGDDDGDELLHDDLLKGKANSPTWRVARSNQVTVLITVNFIASHNYFF
ncbi:MAG: hypothetical protein AUJ37_03545 [Candidatus Magasanikbacteria bacterium CG1_02_41_34]|nr:MAG: hypothetical protein AUJ37_03545 [Candidatus Magasanikbacteria bacterium CG1_02_41_34]